MLHHVPSGELRDRVLAGLARVVQPGGRLAGEDSLPSDGLRDFHEGDTYVPVDPDGLTARLTAAGWLDVEVLTNEWATRFRGAAPACSWVAGRAAPSRPRPGARNHGPHPRTPAP